MDRKILTKNQIDFLGKMKTVDFFAENFYLTGGTALAAFYLHHRYSEDLDFFSEKDIDMLNLDISMNKIKKELNISKIDFQQSYNRNLFFCKFAEEVLKIEFTFFPFPRIEKQNSLDGIAKDSILDIAVNKLFTIYQRTQARDYIDLFCICKEKGFSMVDLIQKAKVKFDWHIDPLQLGTQFVKVKEAKDYPRMIKKISDSEWQTFFIDEAKKLKEKVVI